MPTRTDRDIIDYSHEAKLARSPLIRFFLRTVAVVFFAIGIVGIFLPILPTTPFILIAAACYARSSVRFYNAMMNHPKLGPPLRRWKEKGAISRKNKKAALSILAISLIPTIIFVPVLTVKVLLVVVGISVALFLATRPE